MRKVYNRYRLPMIVTENGMACSETLGPDGCIHDPYRIEYLKEHIEQIGIMIAEGLPVFGYCPWSFVDVVSSHQVLPSGTAWCMWTAPRPTPSSAPGSKRTASTGTKRSLPRTACLNNLQSPHFLLHSFSPSAAMRAPCILPVWLPFFVKNRKGVPLCILLLYLWGPSAM